ncbi:MAG: nitroreductase family protein [Oscillospiraceae bacterium]|jgi:nitroreductase|nr:nitroreductase family protein [Oscillospiraceae bacterium]
MELNEALSRRYSCRKYAPRPLEREKLIACAEAGRSAPSACNLQPWVFVAVDNPQKCAAVAAALSDEDVRVNTFAHTIPAYIVIVGHPPRNPNDKQRLLLSRHNRPDMDIGIAAENICLAATAMGLGSIMMGWFRKDVVSETLNIPPHLEPALIIGIGYPQSEPARRTPRLEAAAIIRFNDYNGSMGGDGR